MNTSSRRTALPRVGALSRPEPLAAAVVLLLAAFAGWTGFQITAVVLDETVYKFVAARYADSLGTISGDETSRGVARLYSLLISPLFSILEGDVAVRVARAVNALLFGLTAVPVYVLALRAGATRLGASIAAVGAVAVPWLTLSTILFTESLAYLLFACTVLAMLRLLEAPSLRREVVVLALLGALVVTRMQFLAVGIVWIAFLAYDQARSAPRKRPWRAFPLTFGLTALALLVVLVRPRTITGPYYEIQNREQYSGDFGLGFLWEVEMLTLGVGVVPVLLATAWTAAALGGQLGAGCRALARVGLTLLGAVFVGTLLAQSGFLDFRSEERYFVYAVPLIWVAAAGALAAPALPARRIGWAGVALAAIIVLVPNPVGATGEQIFLGPVSAVLADLMPRLERDIADVLGVAGAATRRDMLGLLALVLTALAVLGWRRGGAARTVILVPAFAVQVAFAAYAFTGIHGGLTNIGGITGGPPFAEMGWVDRGTDGGPHVRLLDNQAADRDFLQRGSVFWNDEVLSFYLVPELEAAQPSFPLGTLPAGYGRVVDPLRLDPPPAGDLLISAVDSPRWQLDAREVLRSPDERLALVEPAADLRWLARGLDFDGQLTRNTELLARGGHRVEIELVAPTEDKQALATATLGGRTVRFDSRRSARTVARFDLCESTGIVRGSLDVVGAVEIGGRRFSAALVRSVRVTPCR